MKAKKNIKSKRLITAKQLLLKIGQLFCIENDYTAEQQSPFVEWKKAKEINA